MMCTSRCALNKVSPVSKHVGPTSAVPRTCAARAKHPGTVPTTKADPKSVYIEIKQRLLKFRETPLERQMRVKKEFDELHKTRNMSALQFEAVWENKLAELVKVGLGKSPLETYLAYLEKIGPIGAKVRADKDMRDDGSGTLVLRPPNTWEEAHAVVCKLESEQSNDRAFTSHMRGGPQQKDKDKAKTSKPSAPSTSSKATEKDKKKIAALEKKV